MVNVSWMWVADDREPEGNLAKDKSGKVPHVEEFLREAKRLGVDTKKRVAVLPEREIAACFDLSSGDKRGA